eukprot:g10018.t1
MTPSSRIGSSFAGCAAAAGLFLFALARSSVSATAAPPRSGSELLPPLHEPPAAAPAVGTRHLRSSDAEEAFGQVDVFIDLACPKSAAVWPTLKWIVKEERHRVDFVFHVLPLSDYPIGYFAAKVVQVILANSGGTYDDVEGFIDWVFRGQRILLFEQDVDMSLDAREIVTDWALSTSRLSREKLYSDMRDPAFDDKVLNDLENRFLTVAIANTPTVLINGMFMMHLEKDRQLQDFERLLSGDHPDSSSYEGPIADDDVDYTTVSSWQELDQDERDEYDDMERARKAQQAARERRRFQQVEQRVQQQLHDLDVQQRDQLKQLLHLQQDELKHLLQQRDQMEAHMLGAEGSLPPESSTPSLSSALGFSTTRYSMPHYTAVSSASASSSSSSTTSTTSTVPSPPPQSSSSQSLTPLYDELEDEPDAQASSEKVDEPDAEDTLFEEAMRLATEWAARRDSMEQHILQQTRQQQDVRAGQGWLSFLRYSGWPRLVAATPREESVQGGSSAVGAAGQEGPQGTREGEPRSQLDHEGINFEEREAAAAYNVVEKV